jgi:heptosyltransferase I
LIVKCSSLGDILQSFIVAEYLRKRFPQAKIDWLVQKNYEDLVAAHPCVDEVIGVDLKSGFLSVFSQIKKVRTQEYDWIFDLQGNCKSVLFTFFARGEKKIGFGKKSVREWPNLLVTNVHLDPDPSKNMGEQYLQIAKSFLKDSQDYFRENHPLKVFHQEQRNIYERLLEKGYGYRVMVSHASRWENKKLSIDFWKSFLAQICQEKDPFFYFLWGDEKEKKEAEELSSFFPKSLVVDKLSLPALQRLMSEMDLLLAVDSGALHLAASLLLPTLSFFGPSRLEIFKPLGDLHLAFQGKCPYGKEFRKTCPSLRTCSTGDCLKKISSQQREEIMNLCRTLFLNKKLDDK